MFSLTLLCFVLCALSFTNTAQARLVKHDLTFTWEQYAPNGQSRESVLTNGQFPSPNLVFDEDDDVEVGATNQARATPNMKLISWQITVHNELPWNTTVHWHGLYMFGTQWSDGVPGLTQKPIPVGESFIYRFKAYPAGQYWYHSHAQAQLLDGMYGSLFIRRKPGTKKPFSLISNDTKEIKQMEKAANHAEPLLVSDWTQFTSGQYLAAENASALSIFILVNGKGSVYCPSLDYLLNQTSPYTSYAVAPGTVNDKGCFPFVHATEGDYLYHSNASKIPEHMQEGCIASEGETEIVNVDAADGWASLNFIMASTLKIVNVQVDEHPMYVYEVDGSYINPIKTDVITMYAGERYSVLIKLDKKPGNYTIRVADAGLTQLISSFSTLVYNGGSDIGSSKPYIDYGGLNVTANVTILDNEHMPPFEVDAPAPTADAEYIIYLSRMNNAWEYTFTGKAMYPIWRTQDTPLLYNPDIPAAFDENLVIRTKNGSWIDIVAQVGALASEPIEFPHMLHKHSTKAWLIGSGAGIWNYSSVPDAISKVPHLFNLENPNYKDTYVTSLAGPAWIVMRYQVTNPGAWFFHCHIELHLAAGMGMVIMDGVDAWPEIPPEYGVDQFGHELPGLNNVTYGPNGTYPRRNRRGLTGLDFE
ncbi:multicopper oxidase [Xylona heveae TC161]|uniref:Multicopper oxidase n=1 Tax=Xylona heveae (strain CBS 132557 / TC161) TaxID=1328760 RepID=A0A165JKK4_XYLHT|nr:multicopper oxidase [Xylona heveae TC161]KZF26352.1 multicopper oxidase [Xylona heveae TC161]